jgi:hypothetical protein
MIILDEWFETVTADLYVKWGVENIGFGELQVMYDKDEKVFVCYAETMSKDFARAVLQKFVDKVVAEAIFDYTPEYKVYQDKKSEKVKKIEEEADAIILEKVYDACADLRTDIQQLRDDMEEKR